MTSGLVWRREDTGAVVASGVPGALFPVSRQEETSTVYRHVEWHNEGSTTCSGLTCWLSQPGGGAAFAVALASPSAVLATVGWPTVDDASLSYMAPTSQSAGLALPNVDPGQKVLLVLRAVLTGATPRTDQQVVVALGGSRPLS